MADTSHAYNTVWQLRADAWCRLEEAADRLSRPTTPELKERYVGIVGDLLTVLTPLEPYWAYPGSPQFARMPPGPTSRNCCPPIRVNSTSTPRRPRNSCTSRCLSLSQ